ncbi:MAG: RNA ligase family protein [Adhaeribacter sp.]
MPIGQSNQYQVNGKLFWYWLGVSMGSFRFKKKGDYMNISQKYGRTYHYPFSPGTTSDDRINYNYWSDIQQMKTIIHTEKLDGENNCLNRYGVFARSHAVPTVSPWTQYLRQRWESIRNDLGDLELFGENLYAIHSIEYRHLESYYFVFAVRYLDT